MRSNTPRSGGLRKFQRAKSQPRRLVVRCLRLSCKLSVLVRFVAGRRRILKEPVLSARIVNIGNTENRSQSPVFIQLTN